VDVIPGRCQFRLLRDHYRIHSKDVVPTVSHGGFSWIAQQGFFAIAAQRRKTLHEVRDLPTELSRTGQGSVRGKKEGAVYPVRLHLVFSVRGDVP